MSLKPCGLLALMILPLPASAYQLALEDATKQLLKDSAKAAAPAEAAQTVDSADRSVEKAKNLKESMERTPVLRESSSGATGQSGGVKELAIDSAKETVAPEDAKTVGQLNPAKKPLRDSAAKRQHRGRAAKNPSQP